MLSYDDSSWLEYWGGSGVRSDNGEVVHVRIGLLPPRHGPVIAIRIGDNAAPVLLNSSEAKNLQAGMEDAFSEQEIYRSGTARRRQKAARQLLGDAVLGRAEWDAIPAGLHSDDPEKRKRAVAALAAAAPPDWTAGTSDDQGRQGD